VFRVYRALAKFRQAAARSPLLPPVPWNFNDDITLEVLWSSLAIYL
jgi:hypothetical protein